VYSTGTVAVGSRSRSTKWYDSTPKIANPASVAAVNAAWIQNVRGSGARWRDAMGAVGSGTASHADGSGTRSRSQTSTLSAATPEAASTPRADA